MNNWTGLGRLTKDVELRYTETNTPIASFTLAINRIKEGTDFIPIKVFGKQAENCEKYLSKGSQVAIDGRMQTGKYEKDGKTLYTTEIIANRVEFLSNKSNDTTESKKVEEEPKNESIDNDQIFADFGDSFSFEDIPF